LRGEGREKKREEEGGTKFTTNVSSRKRKRGGKGGELRPLQGGVFAAGGKKKGANWETWKKNRALKREPSRPGG